MDLAAAEEEEEEEEEEDYLSQKFSWFNRISMLSTTNEDGSSQKMEGET